MNVPRYHVRWSDGWYAGTVAFRFQEQRYRLRPVDLAARRFLEQLSAYGPSDRGRLSLLALRSEFRALLRHEPIRGLMWCVLFGDRFCRRLAVWLLGRAGYRFTVPVIAYCQMDDDPAVRRQVAKALRRLGVWQSLRDMAAFDPDPLVRRLAAAAAHPPAPFQDRLSRFLAGAGMPPSAGEMEPAVTSSTCLLAADHAGTHGDAPGAASRPRLVLQATPGVGLPPKTSWFIRMILERIRRLVRGGDKSPD